MYIVLCTAATASQSVSVEDTTSEGVQDSNGKAYKLIVNLHF